MDFVVECIPRPWPKKELNRRTITIYPRDKGGKFKEYKSIIQTTVVAQQRGGGYILVTEKPISLTCHFFLPRPKTVKRKYPTVKPDLDNLQYAISNILQGICYRDDAQVVKMIGTKDYAENVFKRWPIEALFDAHVLAYLSQCRQPFTGVFIRVEEVM